MAVSNHTYTVYSIAELPQTHLNATLNRLKHIG